MQGDLLGYCYYFLIVTTIIVCVGFYSWGYNSGIKKTNKDLANILKEADYLKFFLSDEKNKLKKGDKLS